MSWGQHRGEIVKFSLDFDSPHVKFFVYLDDGFWPFSLVALAMLATPKIA